MKEQLQSILDKLMYLAGLVRPDTAEDRECRELMVLVRQAQETAGAEAPEPVPGALSPEQVGQVEFIAKAIADAAAANTATVSSALASLDAKIEHLAQVVMAPATAAAEPAAATA